MEGKELNNIKFKKIELSDDQLDDVYGGANMTKCCLDCGHLVSSDKVMCPYCNSKNLKSR